MSFGVLYDESKPFEWTQSFGDQLALNHFPEPLVRRLRRLCEANPVGAEDLVQFVVEVFDAGHSRGEEVGYARGFPEGESEGRAREKEAVKRRLEAQQAQVRAALDRLWSEV